MREQLLAAEKVRAIEWRGEVLCLLDQRLLPGREVWLSYDNASGVAEAIRERVVRGAAAIGIAAAYGVVLGARQHLAAGGNWQASLQADMQLLAASSPTAANLCFALNVMRDCLSRLKGGEALLAALEAEAMGIHQSDREANLLMAQFGVELMRTHYDGPQAVLTHCNAGALATGGFGTALGVIRGAWMDGLVEHVYVDETRPWLQGSRLTAWELAGEEVPVSVNVDAAVAHLMKTEQIGWIIVGADRIAANGDVASRIGTYQLAILAMHHGVRFMVVAPASSIDMSLDCGEDIPLEERADSEVLSLGGQLIAAQVRAVNPVFDVTPADLIDAIVTEKGIVERPDAEKLAQLLCRKRLH